MLSNGKHVEGRWTLKCESTEAHTWLNVSVVCVCAVTVASIPLSEVRPQEMAVGNLGYATRQLNNSHFNYKPITSSAALCSLMDQGLLEFLFALGNKLIKSHTKLIKLTGWSIDTQQGLKQTHFLGGCLFCLDFFIPLQLYISWHTWLNNIINFGNFSLVMNSQIVSTSTDYRSVAIDAYSWSKNGINHKIVINFAGRIFIWMLIMNELLFIVSVISVCFSLDDEQSFFPPRSRPHRWCPQSGWRFSSVNKWGESLTTYQPIGTTLMCVFF